MLLIEFRKKEINYSICTLLIITYWIAGIIASILQVKGQIIMIAIACFSYILYFLYSKIEEKQKYYEIAVGFLGEEIPLKAKLDTGNELKDGLFGEPVIVISEEKAKDFITDNYLTMIKEHQPCMHILWDDRAKARIIDLNEGINFQAEYFLSRIYE